MTTQTVSPHRATILVGFGTFGRDVLRHMLASTAPRGVLAWEEARGGAAPSERHLQDLALLWVPDPLRADAADWDGDSEGSALELMRDLYRQIRLTGIDDAPAELSFTNALVESAETLLSAAGRAGRTDALPLGLDVIVLARPTGRVLGTLDRLLLAGIDKLANNSNLRRAVQGSDALNFLTIFDFDNYWDRSEQGRAIRRTVQASIEFWQKRRAAEKPSIGRFYLVDGRTDDGFRDGFARIDEISLFLEFLLFEGQRAGDVRRLYQSAGPHESPVSTFGIRLVERSAGLLAHLAAARFGVGWLDYLAGNGPYGNAIEPLHLREQLVPFAAEKLDALLDAASLRTEIDTAFDALESELTALPVELPDWPQRVRTRYAQTLQQLEAHISAKAYALMAGISRNHLARLPSALQAGIDADLHDENNPVAVGAAINELETLYVRLEDLRSVEPPSPAAAEQFLQRIEKLHDEYACFHQERVDTEGLRRWWPLLAIALAAGLTPIVHEFLADIPPPDSMRFLLGRAHAFLQRINNPIIVGLSLFLGSWTVGALTFQRGLTSRLERGRRFYNDAERGRFVDRLRSGLKPGGPLRAPVDHLIDRILYTMALSIRGEVTREVGRVLSRLRERSREMVWLRDQLRDFLRMHGFTGEELKPDRGRLDRDGTGMRHAIERGEDFEAMLKGNPPIPDRFRSTQASGAPFAGWDERYSRTFLVPLEFLDRLSRIYKDPFQQELARPGRGPEQQRIARELLDFLARNGRFGLAFRFEAQEGVPPDQRYCLVPPLWRHLEGVEFALSGLRMNEQSILEGGDNGRGYLLRLQSGVDPRCLLELE